MSAGLGSVALQGQKDMRGEGSLSWLVSSPLTLSGVVYAAFLLSFLLSFALILLFHDFFFFFLMLSVFNKFPHIFK